MTRYELMLNKLNRAEENYFYFFGDKNIEKFYRNVKDGLKSKIANLSVEKAEEVIY